MGDFVEIHDYRDRSGTKWQSGDIIERSPNVEPEN